MPLSLLLDVGLSANERANDFSPDGPIVFSAARNGKFEVVELLLDRGARLINHDYEMGNVLRSAYLGCSH